MNTNSAYAGTKLPPLMAHLVAGYPDNERAFEVSRGLHDGGAAYLEIQFPFSDPSADGPSIQEACTISLSRGFRTDSGFEFVRKVVSRTGARVFIMSYANLVFRRGVERFVLDAKASGAVGLIVPDLPFDSDEGLYQIGSQAGIAVVPVIAPDVSQERLDRITAVKPEYIYTAIRTGITGSYTDIGKSNLAFLQKVKETGVSVMAGFGLRTHEQLTALAGFVDVAIAGSVFVDSVKEAAVNSGERLYEVIRRKTEEMIGG